MSRNARRWGLYSVAWLPLLVGYAMMLQRMSGVPTLPAWIASANYTLSAALLGVLTWHVSGRLPWPERSHAIFLLQQLALACVYSLLWLGAIIAHMAVHLGIGRAASVASAFATWQLLSGLWVYGLIAGVSYALRITAQLREREAAQARAEAQRMRAELHVLRGQLNPHFLFNTLHTLGALVNESPAQAQEAVHRLADLLRYVLDARRSERDEVIVAEELEFVRDYLALEQMRFGPRLQWIEEIDEDALELVIPSLTLQPLVENAIKHGVEPRAEGGHITLRASVDGDVLTLQVADDGPGASDDAVDGSRGVGLRAVRQRIDTRYGARGSFLVDTAPGQGFRVSVTLPARITHGVTAENLVLQR